MAGAVRWPLRADPAGRRAEMNRARGRELVSVLMVVAVLVALGPVSPRALLAQEEQTGVTVRYSQFLSVKPGPLSGRVLYPDGKTPAANVPVRVWDVEKEKFIHQVKTDEKGNYSLPRLAPGRYRVTFGDRVVVDLRVADTASMVGPLNVIIPRGKPTFTTEQLEAEVAAGAGGKLLPTLLIVGAGGATAVGVVALAGGFSGGGGGGKKIVSP